MEYTLVESQGMNKVKIFCEEQDSSIILSRNELEKALRLLNAVDGINSVGAITNQISTVSRAEHPRNDVVEIRDDVEDLPIASKQAMLKSEKMQNPKKNIDMEKVKIFLSRIQKEQKIYNQERDDPDGKESEGISETAISRAIKAMYPSIDKNTMFIALNRSAIGMDREMFEITFQRALAKDQEDFDDE